MPSTTTEIAVFPLVAGSEPGDPSSQAAKVLSDAIDTLKQQDGMQQVHFGTQVENPGVFQLMVNWDTIDKHKDFMATPTYKPFLDHFLTMVDTSGTPPSMMHADFVPAGALSRAFSAPVTEVATVYFDGAPPSSYLDDVTRLGQIMDKEQDAGYLGLAVGLTHEEVEYEGVKGKAAVVAIGWQTVKAHMDFRTTQAFKDNIHLLRSEAKKIEMHHVQFMQAQ